jgi:hypothetical protein
VLRSVPWFHFSPAMSRRAGPGLPNGPDGGQDDEMDSHDGQRDPDSALILEGIRALHIRMDELEGRVMPVDPADPASYSDLAGPAGPVDPASYPGSADPAGPASHPGPAGHSGPAGPAGFAGPAGAEARLARARLGGGGRFGLGFVPAWRRPTEGEARWQVSVAVAAAVALQFPLPGRLVLLHPDWLLPALEGLLLLALVMANPRRINRESRALRLLGLTFAALLSAANAFSVAELVIGLVNGTMGNTAGPLLVTGGSIWLTNIIVWGLWYWEFDRGGPVARANADRMYPDFQFAQMATPQLAPPDWEPAFADYLYLSFTNAAAFSPTDVLPLSRWSKMAMTAQATVSIVTVALVVARAVNILK